MNHFLNFISKRNKEEDIISLIRAVKEFSNELLTVFRDVPTASSRDKKVPSSNTLSNRFFPTGRKKKENCQRKDEGGKSERLEWVGPAETEGSGSEAALF